MSKDKKNAETTRDSERTAAMLRELMDHWEENAKKIREADDALSR